MLPLVRISPRAASAREVRLHDVGSLRSVQDRFSNIAWLVFRPFISFLSLAVGDLSNPPPECILLRHSHHVHCESRACDCLFFWYNRLPPMSPLSHFSHRDIQQICPTFSVLSFIHNNTGASSSRHKDAASTQPAAVSNDAGVQATPSRDAPRHYQG